jgi:hypothetical protein
MDYALMQFIWNEEGKDLALKEFLQQHIVFAAKLSLKLQVRDRQWPGPPLSIYTKAFLDMCRFRGNEEFVQ